MYLPIRNFPNNPKPLKSLLNYHHLSKTCQICRTRLANPKTLRTCLKFPQKQLKHHQKPLLKFQLHTKDPLDEILFKVFLYDEEQFGCGKRQRVPTSRANAGVADVEGAFILEEDGVLESGGVELNIDKAEWFGQAIEQAMVISEDEPSLTEALGGDECSAWTDVIDAELTQMEKVNT
jgi:hypothetical protein